MKKYFIFLFFLFNQLETIAQKENNIWVFGGLTGLDFNTTPPTMITSQMSSMEGCASICNSAGELLFYSNGLNVYNKLHQVMPNGNDILGGIETNATQGVAIAAVSGFNNFYFLFTLDEYNDEKTGQLRYSLIDMNLNMGLGDVVSSKKNILLGKGMSEKMIVAPTCNGVWLITHHIDSSIFYAYKVSTPIAPLPAVTSKNIGFNQSRNYYIGEMKLSHKSDKIALANWRMPIAETIYNRDPKIELFDFDVNSGVVSNLKVIDSSTMAYSVEFSPDDSKLYYIEYGARLFQYDLSLLPNLNAVTSSKTRIGLKNEYKSLRAGPDNKIYVANGNFSTDIFRINQPNNLGNFCDLDTTLISFHNYMRYSSFGNKNTPPIYIYDSIKYSRMDTSICIGKEIKFSEPNVLLSDSEYNLINHITNEGIYLKAKIENCQIRVDSIFVSYSKNDSTFSRFDTSICNLNSIILKGNNTYSNFVWSDGEKSLSNVFKPPTEPKLLYSWNKACKVNVDTFIANFTNLSNKIPDAEICKDSFLIIDVSATNADSYEWSDGDSTPLKKLTQPGNYSILFNKNGCKSKEDLNVSLKNCDPCIIMPNAFSPNDDGKNDFIKPIILCDIKSYYIIIMNRFGQIIFESNEPSKGWDGRFNSKKENMGVYYYLIRISLSKKFTNTEMIKGDFILIN